MAEFEKSFLRKKVFPGVLKMVPDVSSSRLRIRPQYRLSRDFVDEKLREGRLICRHFVRG